MCPAPLLRAPTSRRVVVGCLSLVELCAPVARPPFFGDAVTDCTCNAVLRVAVAGCGCGMLGGRRNWFDRDTYFSHVNTDHQVLRREAAVYKPDTPGGHCHGCEACLSPAKVTSFQHGPFDVQRRSRQRVAARTTKATQGSRGVALLRSAK